MKKEDGNYLDLTGEPHKTLANINLLAQLSARDMTATLLHNLHYFTSKNSEERVLGRPISFLTIWIITDVTTKTGAELLKNALSYMVNTFSRRFFNFFSFNKKRICFFHREQHLACGLPSFQTQKVQKWRIDQI